MAKIDRRIRQAIGVSQPGQLYIGVGDFWDPQPNIGYRRTPMPQGMTLAGPSPPSPAYRTRRTYQGIKNNFHATQWYDLTDNTWKEFPAIPTYDNGSGYTTADIRFDRPVAYPPYGVGVLFARYYNATSGFPLYYFSIVATNSGYTTQNAGIGENLYSGPVESQELANMNIGAYGGLIYGAISLPLNINNRVYSIEYTFSH